MFMGGGIIYDHSFIFSVVEWEESDADEAADHQWAVDLELPLLNGKYMN